MDFMFGDTWSQKHSVHSLWSSARVLKLYFQTLPSKALLFFGTHAAQIWGTLTHFDATAKCYYSCTLIKQDVQLMARSLCGMLLKRPYKLHFWVLLYTSEGRTHGTKLDGQCPSDHISTLEKRTGLCCGQGLSFSIMFISAGCKSFDFPKRIVCSEFELFSTSFGYPFFHLCPLLNQRRLLLAERLLKLQNSHFVVCFLRL